jgi:hypothetical protein
LERLASQRSNNFTGIVFLDDDAAISQRFSARRAIIVCNGVGRWHGRRTSITYGPSPFRLAVDGRSDTAIPGGVRTEFGAHHRTSSGIEFHPFVSFEVEFDSALDWTTTAHFAEMYDPDVGHGYTSQAASARASYRF